MAVWKYLLEDVKRLLTLVDVGVDSWPPRFDNVYHLGNPKGYSELLNGVRLCFQCTHLANGNACQGSQQTVMGHALFGKKHGQYTNVLHRLWRCPAARMKGGIQVHNALKSRFALLDVGMEIDGLHLYF